MEEEFIRPESAETTKPIVEIVARLESEYKLTRKEMAVKIDESEDSFYKYARGLLPKKKPEKVEQILIKLQNLEKLEKGKLYPVVEGITKVGEMEKELIIIYFPISKKESYPGEIRKAGAITDHNGVAGIIACPSDSSQYEDADGLVPMNDPSADSKIPCGSLIAIKKIEIRHCRSGYRYYFFDQANQPYLRMLHIEENGRFRLISYNTEKFSDIVLESEEIAAAFRVITFTQKFYE